MQDIRVPATDGFSLAATRYDPAMASGRTVVMSSGAAIPRGFYRRFSTALASAGYRVITYDYRGIGDSRPRSLVGFDASMRDWGLRDMQGVVDFVRAEWPDDRLLLVGHSAGGQLAGLLERPQDPAGMVTFCSQSGYWGLQGGSQKAVVAALAYLGGPLLTRVMGYFPWKQLGGEDLPAGVGQEWMRWCRDPQYLLGDASLPLERYRTFTTPVLAYSFDDDSWGTERSVDTMMAAYPQVERRHVRPSDAGMRRIGHTGAFREGADSLWTDVIHWLDAQA
ncbi:MAG: alpha/beta fold hydrolase [Myxococcales bacterium]|nr:alpha/beta fold hydrolase [Myxococcales bacterium]